MLVGAQGQPLPDAGPFLAAVRERLQPDAARQSGYVYVETRRTRTLDGRGRTTRETVEEIESYPGLPGEARWERTVSRNGAPVPARERDKADAERRSKAEAYAKRLARETPAQAARRRADGEKARAEARALVDDLFATFEIALLDRQRIDGHETIRVSLTPRARPRTTTRAGGWLRHFRGHAWLSEAEYELVRLEVEALDTLSIGLGLARIHQGTSFTFERRKVNGEVWLPARSAYALSARMFLLKRMRETGESSYAGYRKFGVATETSVGPAGQD